MTPLDLEYLRSITDGDAAMEARLAMLFRKTVDRCLRDISGAPPDRVIVATADALHTLKGTAASIGAISLETTCMSLVPPLGVEQWQQLCTACDAALKAVAAQLPSA